MKLKTNNKFSKWLFKLACKFGYSIRLPEPKTVYITPRDFVGLSWAIKIPESEYIGPLEVYTNQKDFIYNQVISKLIYSEEFKHCIKITSKFNPEDYTTTFYAKLYFLNKKGLEDFYERY